MNILSFCKHITHPAYFTRVDIATCIGRFFIGSANNEQLSSVQNTDLEFCIT